MSKRTCLAIVLAAGEGTRMRTSLPKALHAVGGRSLLAHVLAAAKQAGCGEIAVVVGPGHEAVAAEARAVAPNAQTFEQRERRGTAHAVLSARKAIMRGVDDILVIFVDTPLVRAETLLKLRDALGEGAAVAVLGFNATDPTGYGRLLTRGDELLAIREHSDATPEERKVGFCNGGLMALSGRHALAHPRAHRQRQCQRRVLSQRRGCHRPRYGLEGSRDRNHGGRRARHQYQGATCAKPKPSCSSACAPPPWRRASP